MGKKRAPQPFRPGIVTDATSGVRMPTADKLDRHGLSRTARKFLQPDGQERVADAWAKGRALILNANKPGYSEAFTISSEQYELLRAAILEAVDAFADERGEVSRDGR